MTKKEKSELLKNFIEEFFDYEELNKVGFWKGIKKDDYKEQAKRICDFFGYKTVYEYGAKAIDVHITYYEGEIPKEEPFVCHFPSIYD